MNSFTTGNDNRQRCIFDGIETKNLWENKVASNIQLQRIAPLWISWKFIDSTPYGYWSYWVRWIKKSRLKWRQDRVGNNSRMAIMRVGMPEIWQARALSAHTLVLTAHTNKCSVVFVQRPSVGCRHGTGAYHSMILYQLRIKCLNGNRAPSECRRRRRMNLSHVSTKKIYMSLYNNKKILIAFKCPSLFIDIVKHTPLQALTYCIFCSMLFHLNSIFFLIYSQAMR